MCEAPAQLCDLRLFLYCTMIYCTISGSKDLKSLLRRVTGFEDLEFLCIDIAYEST